MDYVINHSGDQNVWFNDVKDNGTKSPYWNYYSLSKNPEADIKAVVGLQVGRVHKMLEDQGIDLRVTDDAIAYIAKEGYDPQFGARPVKRALQRLVLNELSKSIIAGKVDQSKPVIVELRDGELKFRN